MHIFIYLIFEKETKSGGNYQAHNLVRCLGTWILFRGGEQLASLGVHSLLLPCETVTTEEVTLQEKWEIFYFLRGEISCGSK